MPTHCVLDLVRLTEAYLRQKGIESARLDAELLLAHVLGCERIELYTRFDEPLQDNNVARYREIVKARAARTPCAYLTGKKAFYTHEFLVTPDVLIPRPETELVVDLVLDAIRSGRLPDGRGLDLGTGSGAIAVVLASHLERLQVVATDCSMSALRVALRNITANELEARIELVACREFSGLCGQFAWISSNPPYVATAERDTIMPEVVDYEPDVALFAGRDGMDVLRKIFAQAPEYLLPGGLLAVECDPRQVAQLRCWGQQFGRVGVAKDLAGRDRVVTVIKQ